MRKVHILIMGQFREPDNFFRQLNTFETLKRNGKLGKVIYVTDRGEVTDQQRALLETNGVQLVENEPLTDEDLKAFDPQLTDRKRGPRVRSQGMRGGTIWRQLRDLRIGLNQFKRSDYVLRTRTDIAISTDFLIKLSTINLDLEHGTEQILSQKIWVQWYSLLNPFYIHDTAFFGLNEDLLKLVNPQFNANLAQWYPGRNLPAFFWFQPFIDKVWVTTYLDEYFQRKFSVWWLRDQQYLKILSSYWKLIHDYFHVEFPDIRWFLQWAPGEKKIRIWDKFDWERDRSALSLSSSRVAAVETNNLLELIEADSQRQHFVTQIYNSLKEPIKLSTKILLIVFLKKSVHSFRQGIKKIVRFYSPKVRYRLRNLIDEMLLIFISSKLLFALHLNIFEKLSRYFPLRIRNLLVSKKLARRVLKDQVIWIDPSLITRTAKSANFYFIEDGLWDLASKDFQLHPTVIDFMAGKPLTETKQFKDMTEKIKQGKNAYWCRTIPEVNEYFDLLEKSLNSIRSSGYKSQAELGGDPKTGEHINEIMVSIGRDGTFHHEKGGSHRLTLAKLLKIDLVPVTIIRYHFRFWQEKGLLEREHS